MHTVIVIVLIYAALRAIFKRKPADPMAGRILSRQECQRFVARERGNTKQGPGDFTDSHLWI